MSRRAIALTIVIFVGCVASASAQTAALGAGKVEVGLYPIGGTFLVGYAYLKGARIHPMAELKYRYLKWRINRVRKKFDVYSGGRADDWDRRVH